MNIYLIRHIDNGKYSGYRYRWVSKNSPRTFGRCSDLSNHINQASEQGYYKGVPVSRLEVVTINLDDGTRSTVTMDEYLRGVRK